jgi:hypothetical protein
VFCLSCCSVLLSILSAYWTVIDVGSMNRISSRTLFAELDLNASAMLLMV